MKYFLGYDSSSGYSPIDLSEEIGNDSTNILNVILFTTQFQNYDDLISYLVKKHKAPYNSRLLYIREDGTKKDRSYKQIYMGDTIHFSDERFYFDLASLKKYLDDNLQNMNLYEDLYHRYLLEVGVFNEIIDYFNSKFENVLFLREKINDMMNLNISPRLREHFNKFSSLIKLNNDVINISDTYNSLDYYSFFEELKKILRYNLDDLFVLYEYLKQNLKVSRLPVVINFSNLLRATAMVSRKSYQNFSYINAESIDLHEYFTVWFNSVVYDYDKKTKKYRTVDGKMKINYLELVKLGINVADYNRSSLTLLDETEDEEDKDEEFLEPEDFARVGIDPDETGYVTPNGRDYRRRK